MQINISPKLKSQLKELKQLQVLAKIPEVQETLIPLLQDYQHSLLNPQDYKNDKDFLRAYNLHWAKSQVYAELQALLTEETLEQRIKDTQKGIDKEVVGFHIGVSENASKKR